MRRTVPGKVFVGAALALVGVGLASGHELALAQELALGQKLALRHELAPGQAQPGTTDQPATTDQPGTTDTVSSEPLLGPVVTQHEMTSGGTRLAYTATFAETPLSDASGTVRATISATSYVLERVKDRKRRPVMFLFNGGPGASSSPLHFSAFGPRRLTDERDPAQRKLVDNEYSLLDAADLVFIDPVGTGFSRERPGTPSGAYWNVESDAAAALQLIHKWLESNGCKDSPVFIAGESYGGFRLATMMEHAEDLPIAGLILISPMLDASASVSAPGNDLPYIFDLPSMAVA
ncbi:MAG TPA: alpha/beta hydrolase fold domain-containing protein, partial [Steroidobacteraceae bacterium]|nr:alpha/beta hydrolase fold domain-containing protein [Steroidobacteraceae bacterium]